MRNDDSDAVTVLERALQAAEREIAELERDNREKQSTISNLLTELQALQCPTHMGEPLIMKE